MSEYSLDEPGFAPPVPPVRPSSSESSVEAPVDGRRKCSSCPRRMSKKSADRHTICVSCRGFDCDIDSRCDECLEWSEEDILKYAKYRKSLKSRESSSRKTALPTPPLTTSGPSPQPPPLPAQQPAPLPAQPPAPRTAQRDDLQSQVDSLSFNFQSLSETLTSQLHDFMNMFSSQSQSSCQPRLGPDAGESHPGVTVGKSRIFQGEGAPSRTPLAPPPGFPPLSHDFGAPQPAPSSRAPPSSAPHAAPRASARQAPHPQSPFGAPPQPSTSGWVPPGPPPPRSRLSRRPASPRVSLTPVTLLPPGWLTSFMRSALTHALFLMLRLCVAGLRFGSASLRLRPRGSASECTLASRRYKRRWLPGRRLWLAAPSRYRASYLRVHAPTPWLTTPFLPRLSL